MALPTVNDIQFFTTVPSTKQEVKFTPFTVKQQKTLLIARESKDEKEITNSVINVIDQCLVDQLDLKKLASFDIQYLFLQIRGKSIGEVIEFKMPHYHNKECNKPLDLQINIDDVKVVFPENHTNKIEINDTYGVVLRYPSIEGFRVVEGESNQVEKNLKFVAASVEMVYDKEKVYDDFTLDEAYNFLLTLTTEQLDKLLEFYNNLPSIDYSIEFDCPHCKQHDQIYFRSLADFFMLG